MKNKSFITLAAFGAAMFAIPSFLVSAPAGHAGVLTFQSSAGATAVNSPASAGSSLNWAGWTATGGTFTSVGASWTVPESSAATSAGGADANALSADATWVGIGGVSSRDLIQAGTQAIFQNGTNTYQAWYETLPSNSQTVPLAVHPGDAMTVSVTEQSTGEWNISFADATTGQSYNTVVAYQSSLSSADWIEEMPSDQHGFVALDNFGTASFTNGSAVENGNSVTISGAGAQPLTMINGAGQALATVSSLGVDGASFSVTRTSATASTPSVSINRGAGRWSRTGVGMQGYTAPSPRTTRTAGGRFSIGFGGFGGGNFPSFFRIFQNNFRNGWER
jgi:Peptidase A4 family